MIPKIILESVPRHTFLVPLWEIYWMSNLLTIDQIYVWMRICQDNLDYFKRNSTDFVCQFITVNVITTHQIQRTVKMMDWDWLSCAEQSKDFSISSPGLWLQFLIILIFLVLKKFCWLITLKNVLCMLLG